MGIFFFGFSTFDEKMSELVIMMIFFGIDKKKNLTIFPSHQKLLGEHILQVLLDLLSVALTIAAKLHTHTAANSLHLAVQFGRSVPPNIAVVTASYWLC